MPMGPQGHGEDAADADYWRREAEAWKRRAGDLEGEVRAMKRPRHFLLRELVHGEVVERSLYKAAEESWPSIVARLPKLERWPSIAQGGLVFAVSPTEARVESIEEIKRDV